MPKLLEKAFVVVLIAVMSQSSCLAFWIFSKEKKEAKEPEFIINEEFVIKKQLNEKEQEYEVALAVYIPREQDFISIFNTKNESNPRAIENIIWIAEAPKKKQSPVYEKPFQVKTEVNHSAEQITVQFNPTQAYDMFTEKKHIYNQLFFYKQSNIFKDEIKKRAHFLEISFSDGNRSKVRIDDSLYTSPFNVVPKLFEKKDKDLLEQQYQEYAAQQEAELLEMQEIQRKLQNPQDSIPAGF